MKNLILAVTLSLLPVSAFSQSSQDGVLYTLKQLNLTAHQNASEMKDLIIDGRVDNVSIQRKLVFFKDINITLTFVTMDDLLAHVKNNYCNNTSWDGVNLINGGLLDIQTIDDPPVKARFIGINYKITKGKTSTDSSNFQTCE